MQNKKLLIAFVITLVIPVICLAYFWSEIGFGDIETYNFYVFGGGIAYEIICEENGILVNEGGDWIEYSYGNLPVWDVETVMAATADIIAVMGDGSYSDGIYGFNFINHEFHILHGMMNPHFITYCPADTSYYAGGEDGLYSSHDGLNWENVSFFDNMQCLDMEAYQEHYVVSTSSISYYSSDAGNSWSECNTMLNLSDLVVSPTGTFYGIFPDQSWSSGLYSSADYGMNWEVEFWSPNLSSACFDENENLFVGWEVPQTMEQGIARWWEDISELEFMNEGLPCSQINQISWHPLIDCINIIACTDSGLYLLTDYLTEIEPDLITKVEIATSNYPNPFNPETCINFTLPYSSEISLEIYNVKGEKVKSLFSGFLPAGANSLMWDGNTDQGIRLPSGIYHYQIKASNTTGYGKMILLK